MQALMETIFDLAYLFVVVFMGWTMLKNSPKTSLWRSYGAMALLLAGGDAFHLVPRVVALWSGDLAAHAVSLGFGKLVTSITMTLFYVLLYRFWQKRYKPRGAQTLNIVVYALAGARVLLCLFPQNAWFSNDPPLSWGIWRNLPFVALAAIMVWIFFQQGHRLRDPFFRWMWLAIKLSFLFYIPVVLFSDIFPAIGMLMIPKTIAYVWIIAMGFRAYLAERAESVAPRRSLR